VSAQCPRQTRLGKTIHHRGIGQRDRIERVAGPDADTIHDDEHHWSTFGGL
jgi:hypothetical protein